MYDLFVLGQLMDESMSGYLMQHILQQMVGRQRKISFGMIYPLFRRLNEAGYITISEGQDDSKRTKKIATITDSGKEQFYKLMKEKVPLNHNIEFTYSIKFRNFHQIDFELKMKILEDYQTYLLDNQKLLDKQSIDLSKTKISAPDLENARWVISLEKMKTKSALIWTQKAINNYIERKNQIGNN